MDFKISTKYIIVQTIILLLGYFFVLVLVYFCFKLNDMKSFVISSGIAMFILYYLLVIRMKIKIADNCLIYKEEKTTFSDMISLSKISSVKIKNGIFYSFVVIHTKDGYHVSLYPAEPEKFANIVNDRLNHE